MNREIFLSIFSLKPATYERTSDEEQSSAEAHRVRQSVRLVLARVCELVRNIEGETVGGDGAFARTFGDRNFVNTPEYAKMEITSSLSNFYTTIRTVAEREKQCKIFLPRGLERTRRGGCIE